MYLALLQALQAFSALCAGFELRNWLAAACRRFYAGVAADPGVRSPKNPALQFSHGEYLSFQGGDFLPIYPANLPAKHKGR
jgi:hypothetical protein